ncbi:MAG TPA: Ppx/GppA phosphatase family protein [Caulobacteraceae bacterium]|nr:Ppx/GppA phosphatase family protein [Caulobacteraceae bacterium]
MAVEQGIRHLRPWRVEPPFDAAVLDVGSNSVRLVIFRVEGRAIWTVFNEKLLAGLGRDAGKGRGLSQTGVDQALAALRRFRAVLDAVKPAAVYAAATAAVRDAPEGAAFVARARIETGFDLKVLAGEDEARGAAMGVLSGVPDAHGVAGDLGGSSLELVRLDEGRPGVGITLPLGPFALGLGRGFDAAAVHKEAARRLARLDGFSAPTFYAVGGAWRALALLHMRMADYPLEILQQYEISAGEALDACRFAARQSRSSLERIEGLSKKRIEALPFAAVVMESLIERLDIERVCVSAYGLREGLVFDAMSDELKARDPLIEGCAALGARQEIAEDLGQALDVWLRPALASLPPVFRPGRDATLAAAACRLADLGSRLHPDHRADLVFEQVLRAPVAGLDHAERAFLALALFARHTASANLPEPRIMSRLLSPERQQRARAVGAAMRLGCDLSGRSPILLSKAALSLEPASVWVSAAPEAADLLLGELTARRAATLASLLDRDVKLSADGARAAS